MTPRRLVPNPRWGMVLIAALVTAATPAWAQTSSLGAAFHREREIISTECSGKELNGAPKPVASRIQGCVGSLVRGKEGIYPSFKSLPPSNGLAFGGAFKYDSWHTASWRNAVQTGAEVSVNGSWAVGGFIDMTYSGGILPPSVIEGLPTDTGSLGETRVPRLSFYASKTTLRELTYYGLGPGTQSGDGSVYGFAETIAGARAHYPFGPGFELEGEINGRWPTLSARTGAAFPSIGTLYNAATAPGLNQAPAYLQLGQAISWKHEGARWRGGTRAQLREYNADDSRTADFRQFRIDADSRWKPFLPPGSASNPSVLRQLALSLRFQLVESVATGGHTTPFYFQPTLGGSDLNKERTLPNYPDYRFRAPHAIRFSAELEQPLPKLNLVGLVAGVESGKVAMRRGDLGIDHMLHSWNAGVTLRFGNFPYVKFLYSPGGEHAHGYVDVNLSMLGEGAHAPLW